MRMASRRLGHTLFIDLHTNEVTVVVKIKCGDFSCTAGNSSQKQLTQDVKSRGKVENQGERMPSD